MVTRRPISLTLIHTPDSQVTYAELPALSLKTTDFAVVRRTLYDLNMAVPASECISTEPIELKVYGPTIPDLSLVDLPGYIAVEAKDQPPELKAKIESLCARYTRHPNIILAISAADVDLANSESLRAARTADPRGERTVGVITKMDLTSPQNGCDLLQGSGGKYGVGKGWVGVIVGKTKQALDGDESNTTLDGALSRKGLFLTSISSVSSTSDGSKEYCEIARKETRFFKDHALEYASLTVGVPALRQKLIHLLSIQMSSRLTSLHQAVRDELAEVKYEFKVHYNDKVIDADAYFAETMDLLKLKFRELARRFGKARVRDEVVGALEARVMEVMNKEFYSKDEFKERFDRECALRRAHGPPSLAGNGSASQLTMAGSGSGEIDWARTLELASHQITRSGVGRTSTQLVIERVLSEVEALLETEPFTHHVSTRNTLMTFISDILKSKFHATVDSVENSLKPYKYEVEISESEWESGRIRALKLLDASLSAKMKQLGDVKKVVGRRRLKRAVHEVERRIRERRSRGDAGEGDQAAVNEGAGIESKSDELFMTPGLLSKAMEARSLQHEAELLKHRILGLKSWTCRNYSSPVYSSSSTSGSSMLASSSLASLSSSSGSGSGSSGWFFGWFRRDSSTSYNKSGSNYINNNNNNNMSGSLGISGGVGEDGLDDDLPSSFLCCPEAYLTSLASKLSSTTVLFLHYELLHDFFHSFPREIDSRVYHATTKADMRRFAVENPMVRRWIEMSERRGVLEDVAVKLERLAGEVGVVSGSSGSSSFFKSSK